MQYYSISNSERFELWLQYDIVANFCRFYGVIDEVPCETEYIRLTHEMIEYCIDHGVSLVEDDYDPDACDIYSYSINIEEIYTQSYRYGLNSQLLPLIPIRLHGKVGARWRARWLSYKIDIMRERLIEEADDREQVEYFQSKLYDYNTELTRISLVLNNL